MRVKPIYLIRYGLPGAILLAGVIVILVGTGAIATAAGIVLIGVAFMVYLVNVLARLAIASQEDRDREQRARDQFAASRRRDIPASSVEHRDAPPGSVERQFRRRPPGRSQRPGGGRQRSQH